MLKEHLMTKANSAKRMLRVSSSILLFISIANSTVFAAEATAVILSLNYFRYMGPVYHNVGVYTDSMSCLQAQWRHWEPFYLPYHEPPRFIEWNGRTCSFLLDTKPL